jgi:hypothetical protein
MTDKKIISSKSILSDQYILKEPFILDGLKWYSVEIRNIALKYKNTPEYIKYFSNVKDPNVIIKKLQEKKIDSSYKLSDLELYKSRIVKILSNSECIKELLSTDDKTIYFVINGVETRITDLEKIRDCIKKFNITNIIDLSSELFDKNLMKKIDEYSLLTSYNFDYKIPSENEYKIYGKSLIENGYVIIPLLSNEELWFYHYYLKNELKNFPEYKSPDLDTIFVYGGFGALGNPSSFHNYLVRSLRLRLMPLAVPLFKELNNQEKTDRKLEQIIDRMAIRRKGTSVTAESWHRDQAPLPDPKDDVFGGWINLDLSGEQYFSCVPKTHKQNRDKAGFVKLSEEEVKNAEKNKKKLIIPPGHIFIFYQDLMHEVIKRKMPYDSYRLFTGFRLTSKNESMFDNKNKVIFGNKLFKQGYDLKEFDYNKLLIDQGVVPLPSGQHPPMYAMNNLRYTLQRKGLTEWSKNTFKPECTETRNYGGENIILVDRFMKSLKDYNLSMYKPYSIEELSILKPSKKWRINIYGKKLNLEL